MGTVLDIAICNFVSLNKLDLYGSGMIGLCGYNVNNFDIDSTIVRECSEQLFRLHSCSEVNVRNSVFKMTNGGYLIGINDTTKNVVFENCEIMENGSENSSNIIYFGNGAKNLLLKNCYIHDNKGKAFIDESYKAKIKNCKFENNQFTD